MIPHGSFPECARRVSALRHPQRPRLRMPLKWIAAFLFAAWLWTQVLVPLAILIAERYSMAAGR